MRLIDADKLKQRLPTFSSVIDEMPTIDAQPVKHGRWIVADDGVTRCSICYGASDYERSFCGDCGTKMDGGERQW